MTTEEARRMFRDNGCFECSTSFASVSERMKASGFDDGFDEFVILGDFYGPDGLTDAIISVAGFHDTPPWFDEATYSTSAIPSSRTMALHCWSEIGMEGSFPFTAKMNG